VVGDEVLQQQKRPQVELSQMEMHQSLPKDFADWLSPTAGTLPCPGEMQEIASAQLPLGQMRRLPMQKKHPAIHIQVAELSNQRLSLYLIQLFIYLNQL
jgi:hypothetical protein